MLGYVVCHPASLREASQSESNNQTKSEEDTNAVALTETCLGNASNSDDRLYIV